MGDFLTIEDLARGVLALDGGEHGGLSAAERDALGPVVAEAVAHRQALLDNEAALAAAEAELDAAAREILAALGPEQQAWILAQRDQVSVGEVEGAYWVELARRLEADGP